jgi:hypothetical protein
MNSPWRDYPTLIGKFHPEFPDDVQVMVHEGGYRFAFTRPEVVWVRVTGLEDDVLRGVVLNEPRQLEKISEGDEILFIVPKGADLPLLVSEQYLAERQDWVITPCDKCGFDELFDAPSDLVDDLIPNQEFVSTVNFITHRCDLCGGGTGCLTTGARIVDIWINNAVVWYGHGVSIFFPSNASLFYNSAFCSFAVALRQTLATRPPRLRRVADTGRTGTMVRYRP